MLEIVDRGEGDDRGQTVPYDEAKRLARHQDAGLRRRLAEHAGLRPELLYFLAEDDDPSVRRQIAGNDAVPLQAQRLLARDDDDSVRAELARKIGRLLPNLDQSAHEKLRDMTVEILELLAGDQLPRVRKIVAEELKLLATVPDDIVRRLAHDPEFVVAAPILEYSPLLSDQDLLEIIGKGVADGALEAIARRDGVGESVADAIVRSFRHTPIKELLANQSAQIREDTLDMVIEHAAEVESWHEPLVHRPELSIRSVRRIAVFVGSSLVDLLIDCHGLDHHSAAELRASMRERISDEIPAQGEPEGVRAAREGFEMGELHDDRLQAEAGTGNYLFVRTALALAADLDAEIVARILASGSGQSVTSLVWRAGFSMRTALQVQNHIAKVPQHSLVLARDGIDYPLGEDDMEWYLESFRG